jgi:hypothetical protein
VCAAIVLGLPSSSSSSIGSITSLRNAGAYWTCVPPQASRIGSLTACTSLCAVAERLFCVQTQSSLFCTGGWLQVAQKTMPMSSLIIGIDLAPIKAIRGVRTIVGDITTQKARQVNAAGLPSCIEHLDSVQQALHLLALSTPSSASSGAGRAGSHTHHCTLQTIHLRHQA